MHCWLQKLAPDGSARFQKPEHSSRLAFALTLEESVLGVQERVSQKSVSQVVRFFQI